jgi:SAM-dependent methyltransferase
MRDTDQAELRAHYELGAERDRLAVGGRRLEFIRTTEIVLRRLPAAPAVVADIGGGPGRYALWLAELGYQVEHRDLIPLHVQQLAAETAGLGKVRTTVGDARELDLADASVDAVLLLGPLYHLRARPDRVRALAEARRVVRPGGPVFAAALSRWAPRVSGELRERLYEGYPHIRELSGDVERTGVLPPLHPGSFSGFCHRPQQLRRELRAAGLTVADLVSVEGPAFLLGDLSERLDDPVAREVVLDTARAVERVPEMLGIGPHLLATGVRLAPTDRTGHALPAVLGVIAPRTAGISVPTWSWRRVSGGLGHDERAAAA